MNRVMSVAGSFYPSLCEDVEGYFDRFNQILSENDVFIKEDVKAIIVPHAGYVYSGFTANVAYQAVKNYPKRVVVLGPSHRVYFEGVSVALYSEYETPCGAIMIDKEFSKKLVDEYPFANFFEKAHHEHSTETQMPFVKRYFPDAEVVEIVYGKVDFGLVSVMIEEILSDKHTLLVISTDLSHFYSLEDAKKLDNICLNAIVQKDLSMFDRGCEACGLVGVKALIKVAQKENLSVKFLDYRTSFDVTKDSQSVVGYTSFLVS